MASLDASSPSYSGQAESDILGEVDDRRAAAVDGGFHDHVTVPTILPLMGLVAVAELRVCTLVTVDMINQAGGQVDRDRYGRLIAEVYATQAVLVSEGLAWSYRRYHANCPSADMINQVEAEAMAAGVGVFGGGHVEPWKWRQR
jgi:hypothetical protein